uniref:Uncharacterized protein n=1 Tax=Rhizophagus irregularis (strain DAOM 181602 / DAOM 197198 / MUCL 43194) TaxID=747089 RepID=U9TXB1_RHIID
MLTALALTCEAISNKSASLIFLEMPARMATCSLQTSREDLMAAASPSGEGWRVGTSKATDLPLSLVGGFVETGRGWACIEDSKDVLVGGG